MIVTYFEKKFELDRFIFLYNLLLKNSKIIDNKFYFTLSKSPNINDNILINYNYLYWNYFLLRFNLKFWRTFGRVITSISFLLGAFSTIVM